jgi:hypothetical protein
MLAASFELSGLGKKLLFHCPKLIASFIINHQQPVNFFFSHGSHFSGQQTVYRDILNPVSNQS